MAKGRLKKFKLREKEPKREKKANRRAVVSVGCEGCPEDCHTCSEISTKIKTEAGLW